MDIKISGNCKPSSSLLAAKRVPENNLKKHDTDVYFESFYTLHDFKIDTSEKKDFVMKDVMDEVLAFWTTPTLFPKYYL